MSVNISSVKAMAYKRNEKLRKMKEKNGVEEIIDVEAFIPIVVSLPPHWISTLNVQDEQVLLKGKWLNDSLINAGQRIIHSAYPHVQGLQDVNLGQNLGFNVEPGEFVQVLHVGCHWVTISTIGCSPAEVDIFDSALPSFTGSLQRQIAALLSTDKNAIIVRYVIYTTVHTLVMPIW